MLNELARRLRLKKFKRIESRVLDFYILLSNSVLHRIKTRNIFNASLHAIEGLIRCLNQYFK